MLTLPQIERAPRGGSDVWDDGLAGQLLLGEFFDAEPEPEEPEEIETVHAAQPTRRRRRWRPYENLPRLEEIAEQVAAKPGPNSLGDATDFQIVAESKRLATLLAAAKTQQENARQRAQAAEIAQQIALARQAMAEVLEAARLSERIAQEIEELDVAYITAYVLND